jgi:Transcriptional Coactivator p15 (PC4)
MDSQTSIIDRGGASAPPLPQIPENPKTAPSDSLGALQLPLTVAQWEKNSREAIRVSLTEYKSKALVDCRIFYQANDGEYRPSPKGISATLNHLPALADAMRKALAKAKAHGLLQEGGKQ